MRKRLQIALILTITVVITSYVCGGQSPTNLVNASPTDFVGNAFNKLAPGWILYTVPNETQVGNNELVEARISRNITADLYKDLHGRGKPELDKIKEIGTRMRPELSAENGSFQINARFPDVTADRPIIGNFTGWEWNIVPLVSGDQKLKLDVYTVLEIPPYNPYYYPYPVFEKTITVKVNPFYAVESFWNTNWQWIITSIFGPLIGFYIGRHYQKK